MSNVFILRPEVSSPPKGPFKFLVEKHTQPLYLQQAQQLGSYLPFMILEYTFLSINPSHYLLCFTGLLLTPIGQPSEPSSLDSYPMVAPPSSSSSFPSQFSSDLKPGKPKPLPCLFCQLLAVGILIYQSEITWGQGHRDYEQIPGRGGPRFALQSTGKDKPWTVSTFCSLLQFSISGGIAWCCGKLPENSIRKESPTE